MDEKRIDVRSWQVGLAGLIVGAVVFAGILGLWRPWEKLPPVGEVRGAILEADIKQIQKLTAKLAKDPIQSMELLETGAIEVTIERTLEFFTFELVGGKWEKTSSGYIATSMGPSGGFAPPLAPPSTLPVDYAKVVDTIQYYHAAPTSAAAPADTPEARQLTPLPEPRILSPLEDARALKLLDEYISPAAPGEGVPAPPRIPAVPAPGER